MPEKQHFVYKFFFERFSSDAEQSLIRLYNLKSGKIIIDPPYRSGLVVCMLSNESATPGCLIHPGGFVFLNGAKE